jgi:nitroreductase
MSAEPSTTPSGAFEHLLQERYSCRAFLPRQVDTATIMRILQIAQRTPSWCNSQPWQAVITRGAGTDRFRSAMFEFATGNKP